MNDQPIRESRVGHWLRVLHPLCGWFLLVVFLYGVHYHLRMIELTRINFSVALEGRPSVPDAAVELDGRPILSGEKIPLGNHLLWVSHPKGEPVAIPFFAWYGPHNFGQIKLKRTKGTLSLRANPLASRMLVSGPEFSATLENCSATNLTVPSDAYTVRATYPHWSQSHDAVVIGGQVCAVTFAPQFGALHLTCNRDGATYQLRSANGDAANDGNLPATVADLPAGNYRLTVSYHNKQLKKSVAVEAGRTNECRSEFILGAARLESVPSGATVRDASGGYLGETPLDLPDMEPQMAQFNLSLSGYQSLPVSVEIVADQTNTCRTNLVSLRYLSAMENARASMAANHYGDAVQATGQALSAAPGDADALALQNEANARLNAERERANAERERQARLTRPKEAFDALCAKNKDAGQFETHEIKSTKSAKDVEGTILQALRSDPLAFEVYYQDTPQPEVYEMLARHEFSLGVLGGSLRICLLVVGQTKDDETQVLFKVVEYQVQHTIVAEGLAFHDDKQAIPLSPGRIQMTDALQSQVQEGVRAVTEKVQEAIR